MSRMDGVLIIDKPAGMTSHDVVARVRRLLGERRIGHTGTLDPFATGVLVVMVGRATRLAQFLSGAEKEYEAVIRFGYATDSGDLTGTQISSDEAATSLTKEHSWSNAEIEAALAGLRGEIDQVPPMYSAKKQQGRKLYELARRGETVERAPVRVTIREFVAVPNTRPSNGPHDGPLEGALLSQNEDGTCDLAVRVACSAGTYIRTLAEDLGRRLHVGAHLVALRRTKAGDCRIADAVTLEELEARVLLPDIDRLLLATDAVLSLFPFVDLGESELRRTLNGMDLQIENGMGAVWADGEKVRMRDTGGRLIAVGFFDSANQTLRPRVVLGPE
jgi:tRNA pseudouridine55 synthase